jgi:c-di-AMP phosphodiesterase-like protein
MEKLGGGGHHSSAATQIEGVTVEEAIEKLKAVIDETEMQN